MKVKDIRKWLEKDSTKNLHENEFLLIDLKNLKKEKLSKTIGKLIYKLITTKMYLKIKHF